MKECWVTHNHLEQMIAEWYEYQGYFVRRNVMVGLRPKGGYECELDIVAFHPATRHLIHIEPSLDADSWSIREKRFRLKFNAGKKYIPKIFSGLDIPDIIEQIAVLVFASKVSHETLGGGRIYWRMSFFKIFLSLSRIKGLQSRWFLNTF
jgi:hypothetical protein